MAKFWGITIWLAVVTGLLCVSALHPKKHIVRIPYSESTQRFVVLGQIGGRNGPIDVEFMVDTGADSVVITQKLADELGLDRTNWRKAKTAYGEIASPVYLLPEVRVGDIVVKDVTMNVMPSGFFDINVLGMSFLSELKRFEFKKGVLTLEQ